MKYSEVESLTRDLRSFADFIEEHGLELPSGYFQTVPDINISVWSNSKEPLVRAAKTLAKAGMVKKEMTDWNYTVVQRWGCIKLEYWASRDTVCTRKQVGTKLEPKREYVETGEMVEKPVYEYDCDPLLK